MSTIRVGTRYNEIPYNGRDVCIKDHLRPMIHAGSRAPLCTGRATARALLVLPVVIAALVAGYAAIRPRPGVDLRYFTTSPFGARQELPQERARRGPFTAELTGWLRVPASGLYSFAVVADEPSTLWVAGRTRVEGSSGLGKLGRPIHLERGPHRIKLEYRRGTPLDSAPSYDIRWFNQIGIPESVPARLLYPSTIARWRFRMAAALPPTLAILALVWLAALSRQFLPAATRRKMRFAALTIALATLATLAILEVSLRIGGVTPRTYIPADVASHYRFWQPGATMEYIGMTPYVVQEYRTLVRFNSRGWRDRDYALRKRSGTYRILVLGDSFVEALNVDLEETFHKRLESMLNENPPSPAMRYEVIALGRAGTTTEQQLGFFEELGASFDPDLVLLCFYPGNDVMEHSPELSARFARWSLDVYYRRVVQARARFLARWLWLPESYLNHFVADRLLPIYTRNLYLFQDDLTKEQLQAPDREVYRVGPYDEAWSAAWHSTARNVERLQRAVVDSGARFLVVIIDTQQAFGLTAPEASGVERGLDLRRPTREIVQICESGGIPHLDLEAPMERRRRSGERLVYEYDTHWNPTGHRLASEAILERITPILAGERVLTETDPASDVSVPGRKSPRARSRHENQEGGAEERRQRSRTEQEGAPQSS